MTNKLSQRQQRMMDFIYQFWTDNKYPPTIRDFRDSCEISSTSVVNYNLDILQRNGLIERDANVSRSIRPVGLQVSFEGNGVKA